MHNYATDLTDRSRVVYSLTVVAVGLFVVAGIVFDSLGHHPPFWVSGPSVGAAFSAIFALYDRVLWKRTVFGLRLSSIPDLNATYTGHVGIESGIRAEERVDRVPCWVRITQTWTRISVEFETEFTTSRSSMAAISGTRGPHPHLNGFRYEFHVEPKPGTSLALTGVAGHGGLARLQPKDDTWSIMEGEFFNDQGYHRFGGYRIERSPTPVQVRDWLEDRRQRGPSAG